MRNAASVRAGIRAYARDNNVSAQIALQNYMLERLLVRIQLSPYADMLVLKGGMLVMSILGARARTTLDMDATLKSCALAENPVMEMFEEICSIDAGDNVRLDVISCHRMHETDTYGGLRIGILARQESIRTHLKVDITTGDAITPGAMPYVYPLMLGGEDLQVLAYNVETLLAEKIETIVSRGTQNTRMRDFYDVYMLEKAGHYDVATLGKALRATALHRRSTRQMDRCETIVSELRDSKLMHVRWRDYRHDNRYAAGIDFSDACDAALRLARHYKSAGTGDDDLKRRARP